LAAPGPSYLRLPGIRRLVAAPQVNQLARLAPLLPLIRETGGRALLDAGSGSRGVAPWLPDWHVTALDSHFDDYGAAEGPQSGVAQRAVVGDIREMPFGDDEFDVVLALDVMEHLAAQDRERALGELARVARRRLIVACPAGAEALEADRRLAGSLPRPPGWLAEHLENGFPEPADLVAPLEAHGPVRLLANESVASHERLVRAELSPVTALGLRLVALALSPALRRGRRPGSAAGRILTRFRGSDAAPAYRAVAVLDPDGQE